MIKLAHTPALLLFCFLGACQTISSFDQVSYEHGVNAKVDTLALIDKATGQYSDNAADIAKLNLELLKAYEYDKGRPLNEKTTEMWEILLFENPAKPEYGIFQRFLDRWKKKGSLRTMAVADDRKGVSDAFDKIIQLESGKSHPAQTN